MIERFKVEEMLRREGKKERVNNMFSVYSSGGTCGP